jgi:hypothetical protein
MSKKIDQLLNAFVLEECQRAYTAELGGNPPLNQRVLYSLALESVEARLAASAPKPVNGAAVPAPEPVTAPRIKTYGKKLMNLETGAKYVRGIGRPPAWCVEYMKAHPAK